MVKPRETYHLWNIECPLCGYIEREACEWKSDQSDCTDEWECPSCEEISTVTRHTDVSYTTIVKEAP